MGNKPILIPTNVTVNIIENSVEISGVKGKLLLNLPVGITVEVKENTVFVKNNSKNVNTKAIHGLIRAQLNNNIIGVSTGWNKVLRLVGVGFRVNTDGKKLTLMVGFSHPVNFQVPEGITFAVSGNDITVSGFDKQQVGEVAAIIRRIRPPEVYKGKGIRYKDEVIKLKPGKAAKTVGVGVGGAIK